MSKKPSNYQSKKVVRMWMAMGHELQFRHKGDCAWFDASPLLVTALLSIPTSLSTRIKFRLKAGNDE